MARGWESKSVEAQQAEAEVGRAKSRTKLTASEAALARDIDNLRLSRQSILQQLQSTHNQRHRDMLTRALAALEQKLSRLVD